MQPPSPTPQTHIHKIICHKISYTPNYTHTHTTQMCILNLHVYQNAPTHIDTKTCTLLLAYTIQTFVVEFCFSIFTQQTARQTILFPIISQHATKPFLYLRQVKTQRCTQKEGDQISFRHPKLQTKEKKHENSLDIVYNERKKTKKLSTSRLEEKININMKTLQTCGTDEERKHGNSPDLAYRQRKKTWKLSGSRLQTKKENLKTFKIYVTEKGRKHGNLPDLDYREWKKIWKLSRSRLQRKKVNMETL